MYNTYLNQLGLIAPTNPTLAFINKLIKQHTALHTFNNLGVLLQEAMSLETTDIYHKLVTRRVGGFCFEHNKLVMHCLRELGFDTRPVMARVLNNHVRDVPRTHRFTMVKLDNTDYLVDCGFGISVPRGALNVNTTATQFIDDKAYQILPLGHGEFDLVELRQGEPFILYRFDSAYYSDADCAAGHLYSISHPDAVFVNNLVVSQNSDEQACCLINNRLTRVTVSHSEETTVNSAKQLLHILEQVFGLPLDAAIGHLLFDRYVLPHQRSHKTATPGTTSA